MRSESTVSFIPCGVLAWYIAMPFPEGKLLKLGVTIASEVLPYIYSQEADSYFSLEPATQATHLSTSELDLLPSLSFIVM